MKLNNARLRTSRASIVPADSKDALSLAYTPGVARPCLEIQKDPSLSYELTRRHNLCAVITDGSAVLGLGDIGPEAGMPVMEGKCVLFKTFGDVDAFPLCIKTKDVDEFVRTVYLLSGSFGGINLEDISAPRCFEIERKLKELCDIPIFHDDQHGTAVITLAGLTNALKLVNKRPEDVRIVTSPAAEVMKGDIFLLRPGERIGVDGRVLEGAGAVNEAALTGESLPVEKAPGSLVSAGTINQQGLLKCEATRVGADTTLQQIISLVEDAAATKAPIAKVADKVSGVFVPAVIAIAAVTAVVWLALGRPFGFALGRAISVLVISCPCADASTI